MNFEVYALAILLCGYEWISHGRLRIRIAMGYLVGGERYTKNYMGVKGMFHEYRSAILREGLPGFILVFGLLE